MFIIWFSFGGWALGERRCKKIEAESLTAAIKIFREFEPAAELAYAEEVL